MAIRCQVSPLTFAITDFFGGLSGAAESSSKHSLLCKSWSGKHISTQQVQSTVVIHLNWSTVH